MSDALPSFLPTDVALPYGLGPDGKLVPVSDVPRGLACDCICPGCRRPLVAKQGLIIRHHFAHLADSICTTGFESMVHLLAKELIEKHGVIMIPGVCVTVGNTFRHVADPRDLALTDIRLEQWIDGLRPDIVANFEGHDLIIEVAVTHKADEDKIEKLRQRAAPAMEIDLGSFHRREVTEETIWQAIFREAPRHWLFNRLEQAARAEAAVTEAARLKAEQDREAAIAGERAKLMTQWALWEEQQQAERQVTARKEQETNAAKARAIGRARAMVVSVAKAHFNDDTVAELWTEQRVSQWRDRGGFEGDTPNLGEFCAWAASLIREKEGKLAQINEARKIAQDALRRAAMAKLGRADLAELWMTTTNPRIGFRRPIDVVLEDRGDALCRQALA